MHSKHHNSTDKNMKEKEKLLFARFLFPNTYTYS
jgi:hypothetical protein